MPSAAADANAIAVSVTTSLSVAVPVGTASPCQAQGDSAVSRKEKTACATGHALLGVKCCSNRSPICGAACSYRCRRSGSSRSNASTS